MDRMVFFLMDSFVWLFKMAIGIIGVIAIVAVLASCVGLDIGEDDKICCIEYMDGDTDEIECYDVGEDNPMFASAANLKIWRIHGPNICKSLATIKRWHCIKKEKTK